jgi:ribonuclease BN (tRNA processing enzyme)/tetratricopeptide (TPR) repeat protein
VLRDVLEKTHYCNEQLRKRLHSPERSETEPLLRYPAPTKDHPTPDRGLLLDVQDFYDAAARALRAYLNRPPPNGTQADPDAEALGELLAVVHDPRRREARPLSGAGGPPDPRLGKRIERMLHRRQKVDELLKELSGPAGASRRQKLEITHLLGDHMGDARFGKALHLTVLRALSDAHVCIHEAEHLGSQSFGAMFTEIPETRARMDTLLDRSLVLNTFVYVVGRTTPWVFAEDQSEHDYIADPSRYEACCETLTPNTPMWIANQVSLLALHHRAYTYLMLGDEERAFCDFHKLIRLLRDLDGRARRRSGRVPGTRTLIGGLTGMAEHHIGRIYRHRHAHRAALRYFDRALVHVKGWEEHEEIREILENSRWRVRFLISQGKATYELGRIKRSLLHYAQAWRAFLHLAESESHFTANLEIVTDLIEWLTPMREEPEVSKTELGRRLQPLVEQFETVYGPAHLRLLAADIMMRLGHLIFILKLPPVGWPSTDGTEQRPPKPDHELARRCLLRAAALDRASTLIAADLLKIRHGARETDPQSGGPTPPMKPLDEQWPSGSGRFEAAARVIEHILQRMLDEPPPEPAPRGGGPADSYDRRPGARNLLGTFLAHTDSSNVKLAQVYRYLMQGPRGIARYTDTASPTIDVVCLRRYSSFFPFLPRPAAFRAPGGGYLVQVCERGKADEPFGIAVDPGPSFLANLYRCGYSLANIQMIVLTHDHADHSASVDALLALMATRMSLGDDTFSRERRLVIVGNESIVERYKFFNEEHPVKFNVKTKTKERRDAVQVLSFDEIDEITKLTGDDRSDRIRDRQLFLPPASLRIESVKTVDHDDANGYISQGFLLSMVESKEGSSVLDTDKTDKGSSVLFTGDTGTPPSDKPPYYAQGAKTLKEAAAGADIVVAHLSSVPLRELRELAGLTDGDDAPSKAFAALWDDAVAQSRRDNSEAVKKGAAETRFLLKQLQFGFRTRSTTDNDLAVSPLSPTSRIKGQSEKHLYLTGILTLAEQMVDVVERPPDHRPLLLIGELREELGTFRTRIASYVNSEVFKRDTEGGTPEGRQAGDGATPDTEQADGQAEKGMALTADIGLHVRLAKPPQTSGGAAAPQPPAVSVLCTTCDLDNDLIAAERFHPPAEIREVCIKGEDEGVFYNCLSHDPGKQRDQPWVESVERFDVFGD